MRTLVSLLISMLAAASATAADSNPFQPQVSFSAWRVMSMGNEKVEGRYHYAPKKHRSEMEINGEKMTTILREDVNAIWNIMPSQRMYMEMAYGDPNGLGKVGIEGSEILEQESLGSETVNGHRTTKYRVKFREPGGGTTSGLLWATSDMIPVKIDMTTQRGEQLSMELRDLEIGPQPDSLFEVPSGYQRFSLGNVAGIGRNSGQHSRNGGDSESDPGLIQEVADQAKEGAEEGTKQAVKQGVRQGVTRGIRRIFGN